MLSLSYLAPILVFGLVIFIHELGHFLAAKALGVYAPRFSIGFGPALFRKKWGETEYIIAALPLGGYVRMASRLDQETAGLEGGNEEATQRHEGDRDYDPDAMIPFGPKPVPEHRWFESKPLPARLVILLAGVTMNILLALVLTIVLAFSVGRRVVPSTVIGGVEPIASAPALSQLHMGDTIRAVNGQPVSTWNDVQKRIAAAPDGQLTIATQRGPVVIPVGTSGAPSQADIGNALDASARPVIDDVASGKPAKRAGLQPGDTIVAIAGQPIHEWTELTRIVSAAPGTPLAFGVRRAGATRTVVIRPDSVRTQDPETGKVSVIGQIGVAVRDPAIREPVSLGEAASAGWSATWGMAGAVVDFVRKLASRQVSVKQLGGPIAITRASVSAAQSGAQNLFWLIALLSVNVAVLNLLPIPILDGGQVVINAIESAKGRPFSLRARENILKVGLAAIAALFVLVMYNDLRALVLRLFT